MLNINKYEEELRKYGTYFALTKKGKLVSCEGLCCRNCAFCNSCSINRMNWLLEEYKEPILTDEERVIVKDIINALKPFNLKFTHITKNSFSPEKKEYLSLIYDKNDKYIWVELPKFGRGEKFVGMELNKSYTLEELGL